MARARNQPATSLVTLISDPVDDAMSDEILGEAPDSNQENFAPGRSMLQKNKLNGVNPRVRQAVTKNGSISKPKLAAARKPSRREIIEQEDTEEAEDIDELDDVDLSTVPEPQPGRGRQTYRSSTRQSPKKATQRVNGNHIAPQLFHELQSDVLGTEGASEADLLIEEVIPPKVYPSIPRPRAAPVSQQAISSTLNRQRRAGSTSSNEGKNPDPALRRKLGELTKKFDALEIKHRKLHDVVVIEAKANFDKLKATSDEKARISTELIQALKKELAAQKEVSQEAQTRIHEADSHKTGLLEARAQLTNARKEIAEIKAERAEIKAELSEAKVQIKAHSTVEKQLSESKAQATTLIKQLSEAQREHANLQAKLATARAASTERQALPGSAMKGAKIPVMKVMTTTAEAAAAVQAANSKIELYTDLTGLLIRGVERRTDEQTDIFDCIQTGRNGSKYHHPIPYSHSGKPPPSPHTHLLAHDHAN